MKLLIYENGDGFSSYIYQLCNAVFEQTFENVEISYLTTSNNSNIKNFNESVRVLPLLKECNSNIKKYRLKWIINRLYVGFYNIYIRNKICSNEQFDAISIQSTVPVIDRFFIGRLCKNNNVIYTVHDVIPPIKSISWTKKSLKKLYQIIPSLIVHTNGNKIQLQRDFNIDASKISVIHHGTDTKYALCDKAKARERFGISSDKAVFLFYGSIREQKGLDILLQAFSGIDAVQLVIAGGMPYGETFEKYDRYIQNSSIDVVKFIEYIPEEWTDELFQACDVICLPYKYFHSQSGVLMKAIKYRRPVIASDVSSFREYINKYNIGLLCKPNDVDDLHQKLIEIKCILDENYDCYSDGLELAAKDNSWEESAKKHIMWFKRNMR